MESDALVRDYLTRLEGAAVALPAARRAELVGEVREHIEAAIAAEATPDEVAVRNVLDRLGRPEEIVDAEADGSGEAGRPAGPMEVGADGAGAAGRPTIGPLEILAILLVTVGVFVVPIVGPTVGIVLVWASRAWSVRLKLLITAAVLVVVFLPIIGLMAAGGGGSTLEPPVDAP